MASLMNVVTFFVLVSLLVFMEANAASMTCREATVSLNPCFTYLTTSNATPTSICCNGVQTIATSVSAEEDRKTICNCLKDAASQIENLIDSHAAALPGLCAVSLPFVISRDIDCNSVSL